VQPDQEVIDLRRQPGRFCGSPAGQDGGVVEVSVDGDGSLGRHRLSGEDVQQSHGSVSCLGSRTLRLRDTHSPA
jgi:hypothetical protein